MYAGVPRSAATSTTSQPPISRWPRSFTRLPAGYTGEASTAVRSLVALLRSPIVTGQALSPLATAPIAAASPPDVTCCCGDKVAALNTLQRDEQGRFPPHRAGRSRRTSLHALAAGVPAALAGDGDRARRRLAEGEPRRLWPGVRGEWLGRARLRPAGARGVHGFHESRGAGGRRQDGEVPRRD